MHGAIADEFVASAEWLSGLAAEVTPGQWDEPGLGAWSVRSLLGHAARALTSVEEYLAHPAQRVDIPTTVAYLSGASSIDPAVIAARGVASGIELGAEPADDVATLVGRVCGLVARTDPEVLVPTYAGGMTLETYLPTRTVELVVHGCDLAIAIGAAVDPPGMATVTTVRLLTEAQLAMGRGATLCLALAGRPPAAGAMVLWPSADQAA